MVRNDLIKAIIADEDIIDKTINKVINKNMNKGKEELDLRYDLASPMDTFTISSKIKRIIKN